MSTLKVNTIQNASGVEKYLCQAWVNFDGTGTVAIRGSGNVDGITDNGTGTYTVNFTNAMTDRNYSVVSTSRHNSTAYGIIGVDTGLTPSTTQVRIFNSNLAGSSSDNPEINVAIFR